MEASEFGFSEYFVIENQYYTSFQMFLEWCFFWLERVGTLFEFNKPILKKEALILKDFEKSATDFEGFRMDFETTFTSRMPQSIVCKPLFVPEYRNISLQAAFIPDFNTLAT